MSNILSFLEKLTGSKEVGLFVIDNDPLNQSEGVVIGDGFKTALPKDYTGESDYLFILDAENAKKLYDFAVEYPTGQVSSMDRDGNRIWVTPNYNKSRIVIMNERNLLVELQKHDMDFTEIYGITYQY
jgi:hypothetical protein